MLGNLQGWHLIIILVVILLLFGAPKLPALARSIGQSMRIFRSEVKTMKDDPRDDQSAAGTASSTSTENSTGASTTSETKPNS